MPSETFHMMTFKTYLTCLPMYIFIEFTVLNEKNRPVREALYICIIHKIGGAWVAQSVECPTLAQVMISQFMSSGSTSGSMLIAQSLEPALDSVSPSLAALAPLTPCLSLSLKNEQMFKKISCAFRLVFSQLFCIL